MGNEKRRLALWAPCNRRQHEADGERANYAVCRGAGGRSGGSRAALGGTRSAPSIVASLWSEGTWLSDKCRPNVPPCAWTQWQTWTSCCDSEGTVGPLGDRDEAPPTPRSARLGDADALPSPRLPRSLCGRTASRAAAGASPSHTSARSGSPINVTPNTATSTPAVRRRSQLLRGERGGVSDTGPGLW